MAMRVCAAAALLAVAAANECGTACTTSESCCADSPGCQDDCWECCISQATFCVKPRGSFHTSTCCPRWTVGCTVGSVGCCDPAGNWQTLGGGTASTARNVSRTFARRPASARASAAVGGSDFNQTTDGAGVVAHALFTSSRGLETMTISVPGGNVTARHKVTGAAQTYYSQFYGGSTRVFPWDAQGARFVFADADTSEASQPVTVYTVDGRTGSSNSTPVKGFSGYPIGMAWDAASSRLVVSTQTATVASFFAVDPATGAASKLGSVERGSGEDSASYYAAYITAADQGKVYRVGNQQVTTGSGAGVEVTSLAGGKQVSDWHTVPLAAGHGFPATTTLTADGFASLAPQASGAYDAVRWTVDGTATVIGSFPNAHAPSFSGGALGYTASSTGAGVFAAIAVEPHNNPVFPGLGDKWVLCSVPLAGGEATQNHLAPGFVLGAGTSSVAGFGIVQQ